MLHPLFEAQQALGLLAIALASAGKRLSQLFVMVPVAICGLVIGKLIELADPAFAFTLLSRQVMPVSLLAAGSCIVLWRALPPALAVPLVAGLAIGVSLGIAPEEPGLYGLIRAVAATAITAVFLIAALSLPLRALHRHASGLPVRIAGAWISAIALLQLALALAPPGTR